MTDDRLPPLNALRAFEAAARHLSFTRAAEELDVTPGAISQQIRLLEEFAGTPLFRRTGRSVLLTDAAQAAMDAEQGHDPKPLLVALMRAGAITDARE